MQWKNSRRHSVRIERDPHAESLLMYAMNVEDHEVGASSQIEQRANASLHNAIAEEVIECDENYRSDCGIGDVKHDAPDRNVSESTQIPRCTSPESNTQHVHPTLKGTSQKHYSKNDVSSLMNLAVAICPCDPSGWTQLSIHFGVLARAEDRHARTVISVHNKIRRIASYDDNKSKLTPGLVHRIRQLVQSGSIAFCQRHQLT